MNDASLDELIQKLEDAQEPKVDEHGDPVYEGFVPDVYDHFPPSYKAMLEHLRTHTTNRQPR